MNMEIFEKMRQGCPVKVDDWSGFWVIEHEYYPKENGSFENIFKEGRENIKIYTKDGKQIFLTDTHMITYTLEFIVNPNHKWVLATPENTPLYKDELTRIWATIKH